MALFIAAWKQHRCPSVKNMNKKTVIYTFSGIERSKLLIQAATWINPQNITLSQRNQTNMNIYSMFL